MTRPLLVAAWIAAAASPAWADDLRAEQIPSHARELARQGRVYHEAGDYTHAIAVYKEAYVLAPSAGLLFNLAQAYRLSGDCDNAAWMYRRYLESNPTADHRAIAEAHLAVVEKCGHGLYHIAITPSPVDTKLPAPPAASLALTSTPEAVTTQAQREKQVGGALVIGGSMMLVGAAYYALDAYNASSAVSDGYRKGTRGADLAPIEDRGQQSTANAELLGLGGVVVTAAGVALYLHGRHAEAAQHVVVAPNLHGGSVAMSWRF
jgi:hypothetical protein